MGARGGVRAGCEPAMLVRVGVAAALLASALLYVFIFKAALLDRAAHASWSWVNAGPVAPAVARGLACPPAPGAWANATAVQRTWGASFALAHACTASAGGAVPRNALVVALPSQPMAHDLVNLRRFCEVAGLVYDARQWRLRV